MMRRLAALAAVAALAGCGSDRSTIVRGGRVVGPNLTIYSSLPQPGQGLGRDMVDAEKLAIAQAGGKAGDFGINFVSIGEGPLGRDAPAAVAGAAAEQVIRDPQVIAVIGTLRSDTAMTTVPLLNAAGILQVSLGAGYRGFTSKLGPGEPEQWFPSGHETFARVVGDDFDQAPELVKAAGRHVAIETEAGKAAESLELAAAVRAGAGRGHRLVGNPARADGVIYAGTDVRSAVGVAESLARENPRARIVFPDELTRAGIASALPRAVRRRSVFVTSAPPPGTNRDFEDAFEAEFGRTPDPYAALAWEAMRRVLDAIEAAGPQARLRRVVIERYLALPPVSERFTAFRIRAGQRQYLR
jgi:ABC-type branched-subunit amino acid transport system substrate-binding protein